jgi:hypothetical protein
VDSYASTLHWGPSWDANKFEKTHAEYKLPTGTLHDDFHVYGLYWDENGLYTYLDNDSNKVLNVDFKTQSMWNLG